MKITERGPGEGAIEVVRFEWGDGKWWDLASEIYWGTAKRIRINVSAVNNGKDQGEYLQIAHEAQSLRLIGSTVAWSFKLPVARSSLDRLADWRIAEVLGELTEIQKSTLEGVSEETKKVFGLLSFLASLFRKFGKKPRRITGLSKRA